MCIERKKNTQKNKKEQDNFGNLTERERFRDKGNQKGIEIKCDPRNKSRKKFLIINNIAII